jgi:hypothetical protein
MLVSVRKTIRSAFLTATAGGATLAFAGCGGSNDYNSANLPCGAPQGKYALVYPANGATGIPDNIAGIIFGSTNGLTASYQAYLLPAGSSSFLQFEPVAPAPSTLPTPNTLPSFANPIYQESASGGAILPAATQITVYLNDGYSNCNPTPSGSFTTQ